MRKSESKEAIERIDDLLASVGLAHGRRKTLAGTWHGGERVRRKDASQPVKREVAGTDDLVQAPGWERYRWLRHGFSTRIGGVSEIYDLDEEGEQVRSLNLGWTKEDGAANVAENRRRLLARVAGTKQAKLVTLRQIHSGLIRVIGAEGVEDGDAKRLIGLERLNDVAGRAVLRGDGMMTDLPGMMLGVQVADCVPVLIADVKRRAVAAFHAGWRGTLARIVERGIGRMRLRYGSRPEDLVAAIGPSIGPCCYSVGEEVRYEFGSQFAYAPELFSEVFDSDPVREKYPLLFLTQRAPGHSNIGPQIHLDLWQANRRQLLDAGLKQTRITVAGECTACTRLGGRRKYFSHRGESGFAGRMMGVVGVVE